MGEWVGLGHRWAGGGVSSAYLKVRLVPYEYCTSKEKISGHTNGHQEYILKDRYILVPIFENVRNSKKVLMHSNRTF